MTLSLQAAPLLAADVLAKYDGLRVPRYTSYPTAPHFGPQVSAETYGAWLEHVGAGNRPASLYIHVPFCKVLCWYCGCHTTIVNRYQPIADYLLALLCEIDLVAARLAQPLHIRHLHWGGGTPTLAAAEDFRRIMDRLRARFSFTNSAEIAVEIDPRTLTQDMAHTLAEVGVNRVSLGVQDFSPEVQAAIHRDQPLEITRRAVAWLREVGIQQINLDLMYGLPHQTEASCRASAGTALELAPSRLSVFGYAHVPWLKKHQALLDESTLPDGTARWRQFAACTEVLTAAGYQMIGLDHFARPEDELAIAQREGRLRRNFQGYTPDDTGSLLGFGASSIGALPQGYVQNAPDIAAYSQMVTRGALATVRGLALNAEDRLRRDIIERLMGDLQVDLDVVAERHGMAATHFADELARLDPLIADGLAERSGQVIRVPEAARPLVRAVAAVFDTYLAVSQSSGTARHSRAI